VENINRHHKMLIYETLFILGLIWGLPSNTPISFCVSHSVKKVCIKNVVNLPNKNMLKIPIYIYSIMIKLTFSGKQIPTKHQVTTTLPQLFEKMCMNFNYEQHKNILLVSIIAATLFLGTSVIPLQSYADRGDSDNKKGDDFKSKISAGYESYKKRSNQDQDNFCYRGDDCEQANEDQQLAGKDNEAKGFNDQSDNLALSTLEAGSGTGTGNGTGIGNENGGTPQQECELCLANVDLSEIFALRIFAALGIDTTAELCAALAAGTLPTLALNILLDSLSDATEQCLIDAGIHLTVPNMAQQATL
jgi:hypothetical protein